MGKCCEMIRITSDTISPAIRRMAAKVSDRKPILEAMGLALASFTQRTFNDASLRAAAWPPKKDGTLATLKKKGLLWRSWRVTNVTDEMVEVGSDRPYAAVHQFGSSKSTGRGGGIPARPMLPVVNGQLTDAAKKSIASAALAKIQSILK